MLNNPYFGKINTGSYSAMMVKNDGTLWAWGENNNHQLGLENSGFTINKITRVGIDKNWKYISLSYCGTLAIKDDGTLWCVGNNEYGQLGYKYPNTSEPYSVLEFTQIGTDTDWKYVHTYEKASVAIKNDGTLWVCGYNDTTKGPILPGTNTGYILEFTQVGTDTDWKYAEVGHQGSSIIALKTDGTIWGWGNNSLNTLGSIMSPVNIPTKLSEYSNWKDVEVDPTNGTTFLLNNLNELYITGYSSHYDIGGYSSITKIYDSVSYICAGGHSTVIIKTDGTLWTCGLGGPELGFENTDEVRSFTQVGVDNDWIYASISSSILITIKNDNTVWMCGNKEYLINNETQDSYLLTKVNLPTNDIIYKQLEGIFTVNNAPVVLNLSLMPDTYNLTINTIPSDAIVDVFYNDIWNTGNTHMLNNGTYNYKVSKEGYITQESSVTITDMNQTLNITLEEIPIVEYTLTINTIPEDAVVEVYYNDQWNAGTTHNLPNGTYDYKVSKSEYVTQESTVTITDVDQILDITLEVITYPVNIDTVPEEAIAEIFYDGEWHEGKTHQLPAGEYDYRTYLADWNEEEVQ